MRFIFLSVTMMGCTRDLVIGVENLPVGESFMIKLNGKQLVNRDFNVWFAPDVSMKENHSLELWYGEHQCLLTEPAVEGEWGFGELTHKSTWSCPGLLNYRMHPVGELLVGESEVTVGLWQQIKGEEGEDTCGADCPKSNINWLQALEFANQMSMLEGLTQCYVRGGNQRSASISIETVASCNGYRLPTDEEWMLFSSQDPTTPYADSERAIDVGWVRENSNLERHPVCERTVNGFGLCDVTGNVWEWCLDTPERSELRRVRGGGFTSLPEVALRSNGVDFPANLGAEHIGFRLVRSQ